MVAMGGDGAADFVYERGGWWAGRNRKRHDARDSRTERTRSSCRVAPLWALEKLAVGRNPSRDARGTTKQAHPRHVPVATYFVVDIWYGSEV